jgi:hypothetical protein
VKRGGKGNLAVEPKNAAVIFIPDFFFFDAFAPASRMDYQMGI